ncbi:MAG: hypothetical protein PVH88_06370 [Ignavibacteria bacterium]|jgi:hypothetical protein
MGIIYPVYCKKILAALFFLLLCAALNAQVVIQEEIEIGTNENTSSSTQHSLNKKLYRLVDVIIEMHYSTGSYPSPPNGTGYVEGAINFKGKHSWDTGTYVVSHDGYIKFETQVRSNLRMYFCTYHHRTTLGHSITGDILEYVGPGSSTITVTALGIGPNEKVHVDLADPDAIEIGNKAVETNNSYHYGLNSFKILLEEKECEEEIVECTDYEPQEIDSSNFVVLGENEEWQWTDEEGNLQTTNTGVPCDYRIPPSGFPAGLTFAALTIGKYSGQGLSIYKTFEDIDINTCIDNRDSSNKKWQFDIGNIRMPIIIDICEDKMTADGWIKDLGDGSDDNILSTYIKDCTSFSDVIFVIDYYWKYKTKLKLKGLQYVIPDTGKFWFSKGVYQHEKGHMLQLAQNISDIFNSKDGLQKLRVDEFKLDINQYPCPEDAIQEKKTEIISLLKKVLKRGSNLKGFYKEIPTGISEEDYIELKADEFAESRYEDIRERIIVWAKEQPWWDTNDILCNEVFE